MKNEFQMVSEVCVGGINPSPLLLETIRRCLYCISVDFIVQKVKQDLGENDNGFARW